jgi:hypothetical protein
LLAGGAIARSTGASPTKQERRGPRVAESCTRPTRDPTGFLRRPGTAECLGPYSALFTGEWNLFHRSIISESGVARARAPGWLEKVRGKINFAIPVSRNAI